MNLLKTTIAAAAITVCCLGNDYPAKAQWGGGASMAAPTYCGARAQGMSHRQASDKAMWVLVNSADITTALGSGRAMKAGLEYQIRAMCPEFL